MGAGSAGAGRGAAGGGNAGSAWALAALGLLEVAELAGFGLPGFAAEAETECRLGARGARSRVLLPLLGAGTIARLISAAALALVDVAGSVLGLADACKALVVERAPFLALWYQMPKATAPSPRTAAMTAVTSFAWLGLPTEGPSTGVGVGVAGLNIVAASSSDSAGTLGDTTALSDRTMAETLEVSCCDGSIGFSEMTSEVSLSLPPTTSRRACARSRAD